MDCSRIDRFLFPGHAGSGGQQASRAGHYQGGGSRDHSSRRGMGGGQIQPAGKRAAQLR